MQNFKVVIDVKSANSNDTITFFKTRGGRLIARETKDVFGDIIDYMSWEFNQTNIRNLVDCTLTTSSGALIVNGIKKSWSAKDKRKSSFIGDIAFDLCNVNANF